MAFDKKKYDQSFAKDNYDRIALNVKKGDKELIANRAKEVGYDSITEYIKHLIYDDMKMSGKTIQIGNITQKGTNNSININK